MEVIEKIPVTWEERLEHDAVLEMPASWEEFLDALEHSEYRIEYDAGQIVSFMGYATELHEKLAVRIGHLLLQILSEDSFSVFGSNLALHTAEFGSNRYYNADCSVVKGDTQKVTLRGSMEAVVNPILLVEVLSPSTYQFDLARKLHQYRKIASLRQILYVDSTAMNVLSYTRHNGGNDWLLREFSQLADNIEILDEATLALEQIYQGLKF